MLIDSDSLKDTLKIAFGIRNEKLQADRERDEKGIGYRLSEHEFSMRLIYDAIRMVEMKQAERSPVFDTDETQG